MGIIKTKGIILSESNMNDFDKMVTILTPNGKIGCAAKGARRPKSLLMSGTQFLCFGEYLLYQSSSSYHINSCDTIEVFYNIRTDLDKLKYASYITKIINDVTDENQNTYKILQLYLNTLYMISEEEKNLDFVISVFKIRLCCLLGFMPEIRKCGNCKEQENLRYFSLRDNCLKCEDDRGRCHELHHRGVRHGLRAVPPAVYRPLLRLCHGRIFHASGQACPHHL